jgi:hypothetical protein
MEANKEFEDLSALEDDCLGVFSLDMSMFEKLPRVEVMPGVTKYVLKRPRHGVTVQPNSEVEVSRIPRNLAGEFHNKDNNSLKQTCKYKLGGNDFEAIIKALRTMCVDEIAYVVINPETPFTRVTVSKKLDGSEEQKVHTLENGIIRFEIQKEKKIQVNKGGSQSLEEQLEPTRKNKAEGNEFFLNNEERKAFDCYKRAYNSLKCFPVKKIVPGSPLEEEFVKLQKAVINNRVTCAFNLREYDDIYVTFKEVSKVMDSDLKFAKKIATTFETLIESKQYYRVETEEIIQYLESFLSQNLIEESHRLIIAKSLAKFKKYYNKNHIMSNLKHLGSKGEQFEREMKFAEKMRLQTPAEVQTGSEEGSEEQKALCEDDGEFVLELEDEETVPEDPVRGAHVPVDPVQSSEA